MLKIFLGDLTHETVTTSSDTMPLNIGYIAAALNAHFQEELSIQLFKSPGKLLNEIKINRPDVIGLSNYCWNADLSYFFLEYTKKKYGNVLTVLGGPDFPATSEDQFEYLRKKPAIDIYMYQESEPAFVNLITKFVDADLNVDFIREQHLGNCISISSDKEQLLKGDMLPRIEAPDSLPSPYLTGLFDEFFKSSLNPFIQTNRGCPFSCTYCHEGGRYFSKVAHFSTDRVAEELLYIQKHIEGQSVLSISDSNFGMFERDVEICKIIRKIQDEMDYPRFINATTGKNNPDLIIEVIHTLKPGTIVMSASVQSMDPVVQKNINRKNLSWESHIEIQQKLHRINSGFRSLTDTIVPLPGETSNSYLDGIKKIINSGVDRILPYTLMLLNGTELNERESRKKYEIDSKFRVIPRSFGEYEGHKCIEVEEVGVGTKDMPFSEYILCRKMALNLTLVYNDQSFKELMNYLDENGIDKFLWVNECLRRLGEAPHVLKKIYDDFEKETVSELWDSHDHLKAFYSKDANFKKLLSGEIGGNLLQKYWVQGVVHNFDVLCEYVFAAAGTLIENSVDEDKRKEKALELENIKEYTFVKRNDIFNVNSPMNGSTFRSRYDVRKWAHDGKLPLSAFRRNIAYRVDISPEQRKIVDDSFRQYGSGVLAIGKISTRINTQKLWRDFIELPV